MPSLALAFAATNWSESPKVLQIEESWELHVGEPDAKRCSPQVSLVMSPGEDLSGIFFVFTLNHRLLPNYLPGGMQVQSWNGDSPVATADGSATGTMNQSNDVVRWIQRLKIDDGELSFEVIDGTSLSWGPFGNDGSLRLTVPSSLDGLNGYRPAVSIAQSQVSAAGKVAPTLVLAKLVWQTDDGEIHELQGPIDSDVERDS